MELKNAEKWSKYVKTNSNACIKVARRTMELLDKDPTPLHNGYYPDIHTAHGLICTADKDTKAGGITGFIEGIVAKIVFDCHERGNEFRKSYNGKRECEDIVNTSLLTISQKS